MIRPVTVVTFLLACGSGLYLYQSKHEVQVLDHTIERVVRETNALREQSRLLATEWTVLNDPERLRQFSDTYLGLKTIAPSQFTSLADLDNRLPAPVVEVPANGTEEEEAVPVTIDTGPQPTPSAGVAAVVPEALPVPPVPAPHPAAPAVAARPMETKSVEAKPVEAKVPARPATAEAPPHSAPATEPRVVDQHVAQRSVDSHAAVREASPSPVSVPPRPVVLAAQRAVSGNASANVVPAPARPAPVAPQAAAAGSFGGSLLGMAHAGAPPAPRPVPVNATYNAN